MIIISASNCSSDFYFSHFVGAKDIPQSCILRRIVSGKPDVINFYFTSLSSTLLCKDIDFVTQCTTLLLWIEIFWSDKNWSEKVCSDHFWSCKYGFNIHCPFLTSKHFIMFSLRTTLMCFLKFLKILHVNNLSPY